MRYFLCSMAVTGAIAVLAGGIGKPTSTAGAVARGGSASGDLPGEFGTLPPAIEVAPVAPRAQKDLAMAAGAVEAPSRGFHRHPRPMRAGFEPLQVRD